MEEYKVNICQNKISKAVLSKIVANDEPISKQSGRDPSRERTEVEEITLNNVISGFISDEGHILVDGKAVSIRSPKRFFSILESE